MCPKVLICKAFYDGEEGELKRLKIKITKNESISDKLLSEVNVMCPKVLICKAFYDGEEGELKRLKIKITKNESISDKLLSKDLFSTGRYINLLLYAVTNRKMKSAKSIFDYINKNKNLAQNFFRGCGIYFKNDKYERDASRIITFIKQENVLEDFLKEHLSDDIAKELSRKEEDKYLYSNKIIFSTMHQKHKIDIIKIVNYLITYCPALVLAIDTLFFWLCNDNLPILAPIIKFSLYAALGFLCVGIIASGIIYCVESTLQSVEQVQKKLGAEQNLKDVNSDKEREVEEGKPSTLLEIHGSRTSYSGGSKSDAECVTMCCLFW